MVYLNCYYRLWRQVYVIGLVTIHVLNFCIFDAPILIRSRILNREASGDISDTFPALKFYGQKMISGTITVFLNKDKFEIFLRAVNILLRKGRP